LCVSLSGFGRGPHRCCLVLAWSNRHDSSPVPRLPPKGSPDEQTCHHAGHLLRLPHTDPVSGPAVPPVKHTRHASQHNTPRLRRARSACPLLSPACGPLQVAPVALGQSPSSSTSPRLPKSGARRVYQTRLPRSSARFRHRSGSASPESNATVILPHSTSPFKPGSGRECATRAKR
jgi:hypothetical protein